MIRILVADDHTLFLQGLRELLSNEHQIQVVGTASTGREALALIREREAEMIILDISMKGLDGIQVTRAIREERIQIKVLVLSMYKEPDVARRAFEAGADGYVVKEDAFDDLIYAIRSVIQGRKFFSPSVMSTFVKAEEELKKNILSAREREVLALIAKGKTTKEIASQCGISIKTVETHRQRIMEKLDLHKAAELVLYAVKAGLVT